MLARVSPDLQQGRLSGLRVDKLDMHGDTLLPRKALVVPAVGCHFRYECLAKRNPHNQTLSNFSLIHPSSSSIATSDE